MDMLIWAIGLALIIGVYIVNVKRGDQHGSQYHDGFSHGSPHSDHTDSRSQDGDWGGRDMSHEQHGGYNGDSGSDGGWGGEGGGGDGGSGE